MTLELVDGARSEVYADGAGAVILEARETEEPVGILAYSVRSDTLDGLKLLPASKHLKGNRAVCVERRDKK